MTDNSSTYTMILPVYNEEDRVERVVDYYSQFAEIIAVDNFSTDRTPEILQEKGIRCVRYRNEGSLQTPEWTRFISELIETDYFLLLSCSEFHPASLLDEYDKIAREKKYDVVTTVRQSFISGRKSSLWGGRFFFIPRITRFVNKNGINIDEIIIHGKYKPLCNERQLDLPNNNNYLVSHLRDVDVKSLIEKSLSYALLEAVQKEEKGKGLRLLGLFYLLLKEVLRFVLIPPKQWSMVSTREVLVRIMMHVIVYLRCWEERSELTLEDSSRANHNLWVELAQGKSE